LTDLRFEVQNILDVAKSCTDSANNHLCSSFPPIECAKYILEAATTKAAIFENSEDSLSQGGGGESSELRSELEKIGLVHTGMATAAFNILTEAGPALLRLHESGYRILLTGHSLGAGTAAILTVLMQWKIPGAKCVAYAPPPCMDNFLATYSKEFVTSIVLRDDPIPRCSIAKLVELFRKLDQSEEWQDHFEHDMEAVKTRAKTLWAPQHRGSDIRKVKKNSPEVQDEKDNAADTSEDIAEEAKSTSRTTEANDSYIASVGAGLSKKIGLNRLMSYSSTSGKANPEAKIENAGSSSVVKEKSGAMETKEEDRDAKDVEKETINEKINAAAQAQSGDLHMNANKTPQEVGTASKLNFKNDENNVVKQKLEDAAVNIQLPGVVVHLAFQHGIVEAFEVDDVEAFSDLNEISLYFSALDDHKVAHLTRMILWFYIEWFEMSLVCSGVELHGSYGSSEMAANSSPESSGMYCVWDLFQRG